jgi:hypothetical protein
VRAWPSGGSGMEQRNGNDMEMKCGKVLVEPVA